MNERNIPQQLADIVDTGKPIRIDAVTYHIEDSVTFEIREIIFNAVGLSPEPFGTVSSHISESPFKAVMKYIFNRLDYLIIDMGRGNIDFPIKLKEFREIYRLIKENYSIIHERSFDLYVTSRADWTPGTFGNPGNGNSNEENSCYWKSHSDARRTLQEYGGLAVQAYVKDKPYFRCWLAPNEYGSALYNFYTNSFSYLSLGIWSIGGVVDIIGSALGFETRFIQLSNAEVDDDEIVYINGSVAGLIITDKEEYRDLFNYSKNNLRAVKVDLGWHVVSFMNCCKCGNSDDSYLGTEFTTDCLGDHWCDYCAEEYLDICYYSDEIYPTNMLIEGPDGNLYASENIDFVEGFVLDSYTLEYIYKSDAKNVADEGQPPKFVHKDLNLRACKHCDVFTENETLCDSCKEQAELSRALEELGLNLEYNRFNLPEDDEKVMRFVNSVNKIIARSHI